MSKQSLSSALLPLIQLLLLPAAALGDCPSESRQLLRSLHPGSECVPDSDLLRQLRLPDARLLGSFADWRSCALACALRPTVCAAVQFRVSARLCLATPLTARPATDAEASATSARGDCVATLLRRKARLAAFFDFRVSDRNLGFVDSPIASAQAELGPAAVRNGSGAVLTGSLQSFVRIRLAASGLAGLMDASREFSIFFSLRDMPSVSASDQKFLLRIVPSATSGLCAFAYLIGSNLRVGNLFSKLAGFQRAVSWSPGDKLVVGMSYSNATAQFTVFFNGAIYQAAKYISYSPLPNNTVYDLIYLGYEGSSSVYSFSGTIVCFGLTPRALTTDEFQYLSSAC